MKLILLRGPSGTGKSTIAAALIYQAAGKHANGDKLCTMEFAFHETDQFFVDEKGVYHFAVSKLKVAHEWNQLQVERSMQQGKELVVVANTFISHWEMERYLELAEEYHYEVELIRTPGPWDPAILHTRNKHSVPMDVLKRQVNGYQPHENDTVWSDMSVFK